MSASNLSKNVLRVFASSSSRSTSTVLASSAARFGMAGLATPRRHVVGVVIGEKSSSGSVGRAPVDWSKARIGQSVEPPYEVTMDGGWVALWQSIMFQHDRLFTSDPFAEKMKLGERILPFSMVLFQAVSMSHVDEELEVMELGFKNGMYLKPAYAGDTFRKTYSVKAIRPLDREYAGVKTEGTKVTLKCQLVNQDNEKIFSIDKIMWYPYPVSKHLHSSDLEEETKREVDFSKPDNLRVRVLLKHIVDNHALLSSSCSLATLHIGQMIVHTFNRVLGSQNSFGLNCLFKQGHPLLLNTARYSNTELVVPGALSVGLTGSAASRALFEVLYEELLYCQLLEKLAPESPLGAISYVLDIKDLNGLEELTVVTLGVKDMDLHVDMVGVDIPEELFVKTMRAAALRAWLNQKCPKLAGKVVVYMVRKLVRQAPFTHVQNIPLL